ncbi:hypothetical protein [Halobacillus sp. A5]|uniref:hypothetical protein n=1 Tax=Halobacillus sp. A5 TaxID=2880263 RepID=UPI0020A6A7C2|nr:hypothetical protein [Halobacillus sp. A5]MCP3028712.1 hypothetical protein [Halobacillus sp. A5]
MKSRDEWIEKTIPDESVMGEPFWTIMEKSSSYEQGVNGNYLRMEGHVIPLFFSKKMAIEASKRLRKEGVVRGVSQSHLKYLIALSEERIGDIKLCLILLEETKAMVVEPKFLTDYFLLEQHESFQNSAYQFKRRASKQTLKEEYWSLNRKFI